jgi:hypothetical protein
MCSDRVEGAGLTFGRRPALSPTLRMLGCIALPAANASCRRLDSDLAIDRRRHGKCVSSDDSVSFAEASSTSPAYRDRGLWRVTDQPLTGRFG